MVFCIISMYSHLLLCLSVLLVQEISASYAGPQCHTVYEKKCHQVDYTKPLDISEML